MARLQNKPNEDYLGIRWHVPANVLPCTKMKSISEYSCSASTKNTRLLLIDWTKQNLLQWKVRGGFFADKYDESLKSKITFDVMFFISISLKKEMQIWLRCYVKLTTLLFINVIWL